MTADWLGGIACARDFLAFDDGVQPDGLLASPGAQSRARRGGVTAGWLRTIGAVCLEWTLNRILMTSLALVFACGGGAVAPEAKGPAGGASPAAPAAPTAVPPTASPAGAAPASTSPADFSGKFWVILQSDRDAAKVPASLSVIAAHPELGLKPERLLSTKFKGLMPCYQVTVASASADKAAALATSKALTALGVDNYVKNAGKYLKDTAKLDQYCAAPAASAGAGPGLGLVDVVGKGTWLQLKLDPSLLVRVMETAGKNAPLDGDLGLWGRSIAAESVGAYKKGDKLDVVAPGGAAASCEITGFQALTVGTPHFGYFDKETNPKPSGPGCGEEALFAKLTCDKVIGPSVAFAAGKAPVLATKGEALPKLAGAAGKVFSGSDQWTEVATAPNAPEAATENSQVAWTIGARRFVLLTARLGADGECGGTDDRFYAVHELQPDGAIGRQVVEPARVSFGEVLGLIDADGDGKPEVFTRDFTHSLRLDGGAADWGWEHAYCDCPC